MKLKKDKQIDYKSNTVFEGQDATIDPENMDKLFDLLQDPYKNPIGAVVREYTSNAFDSHSEAAFIKANSISDIRTEFPDYLNYSDDEIEELKKHLQVFDDDAVFVTLGKDETGHFWSTEDFGVGLSDSRVKNIFCSYLKSTKENTNSAIGAFGIGSKSGLSYTDVIHIRTRYNGVERVYMLRKGEKSPRLDNISVEDTTERNGTQIKIYIKSVKQYTWESNAQPEVPRFEEECKKQLAYFDNVYFTGSSSGNLPRDYKIYQGSTWIKNTDIEPFGNLHLCLGKVAYPIDWDNLGIVPIKSSVALKFEIGELDIVQTREDLKYTPRTKEALVNKINEFKDEIEDKWNEQYNSGFIDNFYNYLLYRKEYGEVIFKAEKFNIGFNLIDIFNDEEYENNFSILYTPFARLNFESEKIPDIAFFQDFSITSYVNETGLKHRNETVWNRIKESKSPIYRIEGPHETKKSRYIVTELERQSILLLRKSKARLSHYTQYFHLNKYPKDEWRDIIIATQKAVKSIIFERTESYQKVDIDSEWLKSTYKARKSLDTSKFNMYVFDGHSSYSGGFDTEKIVKSRVYGRIGSKLCIYGTKEQKKELKAFSTLFSSILNTRNNNSSKKLITIHAGARNFKYLEDLPNLITIENMAEHKLFIKYCTARYILENMKTNTDSDGRGNSSLANKMKNINFDISKNLKSIHLYTTKYEANGSRNVQLLNSFYEDVLKKDVLDKKMIDMMHNIDNYFKGMDFLNYLNLSEIPEEEIASIIYRFNKSLPISRHKRMNPNFYVNLNKQELEWLKGSEDEKMYKKTRMLT